MGIESTGKQDRSPLFVGKASATPIAILVLIAIAFLVTRVFVSFVRGMPDMEHLYASVGTKLFESSDKFELQHSPVYSAFLYGIHRITGDWLLSTQLIYIFSSLLAAWALYSIAKMLFDEEIALYTLVLAIFLPNFTAAVAGYSHTVVVANAFVNLSILFFLMAHRSPNIRNMVLFSLTSLLATLVRPENLLYFLMFVALWGLGSAVVQAKNGLKTAILLPTMAVVLFSLGIVANYQYFWTRSDSSCLGLLGDSKYSFHTYSHTLSLRETGVADDFVAQKLAAERFGPLAREKCSILEAIKSNPREAMRNVAFNAKSLLKEAGHPLFYPVYLYLFAGLGLLGRAWKGQERKHLFLALTLLPCLAFLLIFHVEIRYMTPLLLPLLIWSALGLQHVRNTARNPNRVFSVLLGVNCFLYLSYIAWQWQTFRVS